VGRYYTVTGAEMLYFTVVQHWAGDMTQQAHIWSTIGYNHGDYESYADEKYGTRARSVAATLTRITKNYGREPGLCEFMAEAVTTLPVGNINRLLMEQVFRTYHNRLRSGYDILTSSDRAVWTRAGIWAVRNGTAEMAIITEKAVLDLRKCRNGAACTNN
jgi:hypothetical protein